MTTQLIFQNGGREKFGARNTPLKGEKFELYEGGTKTAAFISGPTILNRSGAVSNEYLSFCYHPQPFIS